MWCSRLISLRTRNRLRPVWQRVAFESRNALGRVVRNFWRPAHPRNDGINLHLGCGNIDYPGFINIDAAYFSHVHYVRNVDNLACFPPGFADCIYASHCLEHFAFPDVPKVLSEWRRVLRQGGSLYVSVPSIDVLVNLYVISGRDADLIQPYLMGGQGNKYNIHRAIFNEALLTALLRSAGFSVVQSWNPLTKGFPDLIDSSRTAVIVGGVSYPISLNLEAVA